MGCEHVIDRKADGYKFWADEHTQDESEWRRLGKDIRGLIGRDVDIVFEHPGRQTFGASVFVAARGGKIVTCAATSRLHDRVRQPPPVDEAQDASSARHFANYKEAWAANQLIAEGKIQPILSAVSTLDEVGEAACQVHHNVHEGKIGVLCLAPEEGLGIDDPAFRASRSARTRSPSSARRLTPEHPPLTEPADRPPPRRRREPEPPEPRHRRLDPGRSPSSPRSTTSPSPCATWRPPSTSTATRSAPSSSTARSSTPTASRRRC